MKRYQASIPLSELARITIYVNDKRKTMAQVKNETGCDYILNAGLFNMTTFKPVNTLIAGGKKYSFSSGKTGYSFDGGKIALSYENQVNYPDHVSGYPVLLANGKKAFSLVPSGLEGERGRSAIGLTKDSLVLLAVEDVAGASDYTLDELCRDMAACGCVSAINLDGGGSTQCDFAGQRITSSRIVQNYICVWRKKNQQDKPAEKEVKQGMKVLLIAGHGGTDPGAVAFGRKEADLARELVPMIQAQLKGYEGVSVTVADPQISLYGYLFRETGHTYNFRPYDYVLEVHFNAYAADSGDGKRKGSEVYVTTSEKVTTAEAAMLKNLAALGFPNRGVKQKNYSVIAEAKRQGASSALVEPCFLDDADDMALYIKNKDTVAKAIASGIAEGYQLTKKVTPVVSVPVVDQPSSWAKAAWEKAVQKGITDGFRPQDTATREEIVVMLERAGVL